MHSLYSFCHSIQNSNTLFDVTLFGEGVGFIEDLDIFVSAFCIV
jgi:hypothetical protein